jgi:hypothetical protein
MPSIASTAVIRRSTSVQYSDFFNGDLQIGCCEHLADIFRRSMKLKFVVESVLEA